jgi:preprotein translocase subunit SecG
MLYYLLVSVYVLVCLLLMVVILLQQGKGGDIASAFGGGASQTAFGARAGATLLTKLTAGLAAAFIALSLTLAVWGQRGPGSVVGGLDAPPPAPVNAPAAAPAAPATPPTNSTPQ